jgi:hypothetical protein
MKPRLASTVRERDMIKLRAELKCYLCGRVAGELEGHAERTPCFSDYTPAPDLAACSDDRSRPSRCPRCGGGLFVDEVEQIYLISTRPLKPEKRGRKPRKRPVGVA